MPRYSIVITCTRPRLVGYAIRSALAQDFDDFEVIVSDNSDAGCRATVEAFADSRVRYVRPPEYFTTVPHWNFAFSHARGAWQLLLCDDDAIAPNLLSTLEGAIAAHPGVDTVRWLHGAFGDESAPYPEDRCTFAIPGFTGAQRVRDCREIIARMFDSGTGMGSIKPWVPLMSFSAYSRTVIECIREAFGGDLFLPICPMTSAATAALALSKKTLILDVPLTVLGQPRDSAGGHVADSGTYERMHHGALFAYAPVKTMALFPTIALETLLRTQRALPAFLEAYRVNWAAYFIACFRAADEIASRGRDASAIVALIEETLDAFDPSVRAAVYAARAGGRSAGTGSVFGRMRKRLALSLSGLRAPVTSRHQRFGRRLNTQELGVETIFDCARILGRLTGCEDTASSRIAISRALNIP